MKNRADMLVLASLLFLSGGSLAQGQGLPKPLPHRLDASESEIARAGAPFRLFAGLLTAMNAGEPARLHEYLAQYYPSVEVTDFDRLRYNSHGLDLRALDQATSSSIAGLVQERD